MAFSDNQSARVVVDSGRGPNPGRVVLAEDCACGDVLGYASGWKRALATAGSVIQGRLIALKGGRSGEEIPVSPNPVISGYSGAAPGGAVYAAEGSAYGQVTQTAPSTSDDADTILGYALNATSVQFSLGRADSVSD